MSNTLVFILLSVCDSDGVLSQMVQCKNKNL